MLPEAARQWAAQALGADIVATELMAGGLATSCHLLTLLDGRRVVLRRWTSGEARDVMEFSAQREALALSLVKGSGCPVPEVLGADHDGSICDVPALLLSHEPGRQPSINRLGDLDLKTLAKALSSTHGVPGSSELPAFAPWCWRHPLGVPRGTNVPTAWQRLLDAVGDGCPDGEEVLLHGDFHALNTLWSSERLCAVLDWPAASRGNALADVARMTCFLNVFAPGCGDRFADAYAALTGRRLTAWWEARDLVDRLPEDPDDDLDLSACDRQVAAVAARL